ncbi:MAG TPA: hypothetical protein VF897_18690, partial [Roseiflexaceae bacterium]
ELADIAGAARIETVGGDVEIHGAGSVALAGRAGGDVEIHGAGVVEIEQVDGDLDVSDGQSVVVGSVGGDCDVAATESFRYGTVGGDLEVKGRARTVVAGGDAGGDCQIQSAASVQIGGVGGDCEVHDVAGEVRLGGVGGDASVRAESAGVQIGDVGGDLRLRSAFPPASVTRITVGGDAEIELPHAPSLTVRATVGGDVSGERIVSTGGGMFTAVYGEGAAQLDLVVGGDLSLRGGGAPRASSSASAWAGFGVEMGRMGEELGREFSRMGEELGREISGAFGPGGKHRGDEWERKIRRRAEKQARHAEERARRMAEEAQRHVGEAGGAGQPGRRVHVRINDREWRFDAERLERLKAQAREAAREGISGAMAAMERALASLGVPPETPAASQPPVGPPPATGQTIRIDVDPGAQAAADAPPAAGDGATEQAAPAASRNVEEERAAILQMVAEGRISPEEGDMLLDALG